MSWERGDSHCPRATEAASTDPPCRAQQQPRQHLHSPFPASETARHGASVTEDAQCAALSTAAATGAHGHARPTCSEGHHLPQGTRLADCADVFYGSLWLTGSGERLGL